MLILKIMSNQDLADSDPGKEFLLVANIMSVRFFTDKATKLEKKIMGFKGDGKLTVSFARVVIADSNSGGSHKERHLLTGNSYVLNDRGKTIESFWARQTPQWEDESQAGG